MQTYTTTYRDTAMAAILEAISGTEIGQQIHSEVLAKASADGLKPEDAMQNALTFLLVYAAVKHPEIMAVLTAKQSHEKR